MKHIFYKPKETVNQTITLYPIQDNENVKDITIFHNIIATHNWFLTLDEFTNSFNDASQLDYLEPEYKEKVVQTYWKNQKEFPNEDLMYFDGDFSYRDKILIANYSKNTKMLEQILADSNTLIRQELTKRKDLPLYIVDQLICDSDTCIRLGMIDSHPLTKEQIKLYIKEDDERIVATLFAKYIHIFDDEMVDYFVKNGSNEIKEEISAFPFTNIVLTDEQIDFLSQSENSSLITKEHLISYHKLSERVINSLLNLNDISLIKAISYHRHDLTKEMVDKIIESNDNASMLSLLQNTQLCLKSTSLYQYAALKILKSDDIELLKIAISYYVRMQNITYLRLPTELIEHLIQVNYKKGGLKFSNFILRIQGIPQYLAELIIFNSLTHCKIDSKSEKYNWYYTLKKNAQYQLIIQKVMNYIMI
jgi:hypothetical protein